VPDKVKVQIIEVYEMRRVSQVEIIVPSGSERDAIEECAIYNVRRGLMQGVLLESPDYDAALDTDPVRIEAHMTDKEPI
jgi:hypothetical protein